MELSFRLRQTLRLAAAVSATVLAGTAGLDAVPHNDGARALSIVLVLAGLTTIVYAGAVIVEIIAGGVLTGALAERRRERTIERLRDHLIICGYGRVGRRVAEELQMSNEPCVSRDLLVGVGNAEELRRLEDLFAAGDRVGN
ncbi:MAG: transport system, NAD-binding component [Actinomycetia bacterium]|jgi:phosphoglycerate dehydrogenase-like enzyme|nr:transport system, NAD-binding component [Actinomycetes bacterium]